VINYTGTKMVQDGEDLTWIKDGKLKKFMLNLHPLKINLRFLLHSHILLVTMSTFMFYNYCALNLCFGFSETFL